MAESGRPLESDRWTKQREKLDVARLLRARCGCALSLKKDTQHTARECSHTGPASCKSSMGSSYMKRDNILDL